jgi:transposase
MQRYQSYKFELRPNGDQTRQMRRIAGCCRFVFNQALAAQIESRTQGDANLDFSELSVRLLGWRQRPEARWLAQVPFGCLLQALRNLERAQTRYRHSQAQAPGSKGKRRLNKSILDQGWFEFRRQLQYKLKWNGGGLFAVPPRNTSITCPQCRYVAKENRVSQALFRCGACKFQEHADFVGALNVLRAGHARLACAETSPAYGASGQEPTDAISHYF